MNPRILLGTTAALHDTSGTIAILLPHRRRRLYGVAPGLIQNHMAQWAGLGSLIIALLCWIAAGSSNAPLLRRVLGVFVLYFVIATAISALGSWQGVMGAPGWILAAVNGGFAGAFAFSFARSACFRKTAGPTASRWRKPMALQSREKKDDAIIVGACPTREPSSNLPTLFLPQGLPRCQPPGTHSSRRSRRSSSCFRRPARSGAPWRCSATPTRTSATSPR